MFLSGRLAIGRFTNQQCITTCRSLNLRRVAILSSLSTSLPRHYATDGQSTATTDSRPVSRPKAHTGRTTSAGRSRAAPKAVKARPSASGGSSSKTSGRPRAKRAKAKPKAKSKAKRKAKPKPKPKPKKKTKPLTDIQKAAAADKKKRDELKTLKEKALTPPVKRPITAFLVLYQQRASDAKGSDKSDFGTLAKNASAKYRAFSTEEREHYNHIANENRAKNALEYRQWIESHTAVVIYEANQARAKLNKLEKRRWLQLQDDRKVRKNRSAYQFFFMERIHSGDFSGIGVSDTTRRVAQEWKALSVSEKEPYLERARIERARFEQEFKTVYNRDARPENKSG